MVYVVCLLLTKTNNKSTHYKLKYLNLRINILPKLIIMFNFTCPL